MLTSLRAYRRWRGGRWARVTGSLWGRRWVRVGPECVERVEEDYTRDLEADFDANVERLKACEQIAEGDEGWEVLRNLCPSTAAVAHVRDRLDALEGFVAQVADLTGPCIEATPPCRHTVCVYVRRARELRRPRCPK